MLVAENEELTGEDTTKMAKQYGLDHHYKGYFNLQMEMSTKDSTYLPLLMSDQNKGDPSTVNVNPFTESSEYDRDSGVTTYAGSKVYKIHLKMKIAFHDEDTNVDDLPALTYRAGYVCHSFDDLDTAIEDGSETVGSILHLQKEATTEDTVHPIWTTPDLDNSSVLPADVPALTADQTHESIAFDWDKFRKYYTKGAISGKLKSMMKYKNSNGLEDYVLYRDRPYIVDTWLDVPSKVVAQNKGCFFGILFDLPQVDTGHQFYNTSATTNNVNHLHIGYDVEFTEYNEQFNQTQYGM